jgi:hypothetical protein
MSYLPTLCGIAAVSLFQYRFHLWVAYEGGVVVEQLPLVRHLAEHLVAQTSTSQFLNIQKVRPRRRVTCCSKVAVKQPLLVQHLAEDLVEQNNEVKQHLCQIFGSK